MLCLALTFVTHFQFTLVWYWKECCTPLNSLKHSLCQFQYTCTHPRKITLKQDLLYTCIFGVTLTYRTVCYGMRVTMCYQIFIYIYTIYHYNMSDSLGPGIRCKTISYSATQIEKMKQSLTLTHSLSLTQSASLTHSHSLFQRLTLTHSLSLFLTSHSLLLVTTLRLLTLTLDSLSSCYSYSHTPRSTLLSFVLPQAFQHALDARSPPNTHSRLLLTLGPSTRSLGHSLRFLTQALMSLTKLSLTLNLLTQYSHSLLSFLTHSLALSHSLRSSEGSLTSTQSFILALTFTQVTLTHSYSHYTLHFILT